MSEKTEVIADGYPATHDKMFRRLDEASVARRIAYKAIDYFVADYEGGLVTWIDSEDEWDGHALAVKQYEETDAIALMYFHVNRDKRRLVQQSFFGFDISFDSLAKMNADEDETKELVSSAALEFDKKNLTYVAAMLAKAADIGMAYVQERLDPTIRGVLMDENLPELAEFFPKKEEPFLPYATPEFMEAVEGFVATERLSEPFETIHLRRTLRDSMCIVSLQFHYGELVFGYFIQSDNKKHLFGLHNYEEDEPFDSDKEGWDQPLLIKTIQTGLRIDDDAFAIYVKEAAIGALDDMQEDAASYVSMLKKRKRI